jgi:hypothetical protein
MESQTTSDPTKDVADVIATGTVESDDNSRARPTGNTRLWSLTIAAGALAAIIGWAAGEGIAQYSFWDGSPKGNIPGGHGGRDPVVQKALVNLKNKAEAYNGAVAYGLLGGVLGLSLGIAGGLIARSSFLLVVSSSLGLVLGAIAGIGMPLLLVPFFIKTVRGAPDPLIPFYVHGGINAALGGIAGLALGLSTRRLSAIITACVSGAVGGILGTVLFSMLGSVAFPLESEFRALPSSTISRLTAYLCIALPAAFCAAAVLNERPKPVPRSNAVEQF